MEQTRKHLKLSAIVVLVFAGLSLVQIISELLFGDINSAEIPEASPENVLLITKIILLVVSFVLLLPQIYVGIKGLKVAKNPDNSKGHIVWACILLVLSVIDLIEPITGFFSQGFVYENITAFFSVLLEITIYYDFIKYARAVLKGN